MFALWKYYLLFHNLFNFFLFTTGADTLAKNLHKSYIEQTAFYNFCCYNMPLKHSTMLKLPNSVLKISNNCSDNTSVRTFEIKKNLFQNLWSRSSRPKVFLRKEFWKYAANLQKNAYAEITLQHECSPVDSLHVFRTPFLEEHLWTAASDWKRT